jgi:hypothetical protein
MESLNAPRQSCESGIHLVNLPYRKIVFFTIDTYRLVLTTILNLVSFLPQVFVSISVSMYIIFEEVK